MSSLYLIGQKKKLSRREAARACSHFAPPPLTRKNTISAYDLSCIFKTLSLSLLVLPAPKNTILRHTHPSPAQPPGRVFVLIAVIAGTIVGLATALLMVNRGNNDNYINRTEIGTEGRIGSGDGGGGGIVVVSFMPKSTPRLTQRPTQRPTHRPTPSPTPYPVQPADGDRDKGEDKDGKVYVDLPPFGMVLERQGGGNRDYGEGNGGITLDRFADVTLPHL